MRKYAAAVNLIEFFRRFLEDLWNLPLIFQLVLLCMAGFWSWQWLKDRQRRTLELAAKMWPTKRARVISAQVSERHQRRGGDAYWWGILTYSYSLPGQEVEVGEHRQKFLDPDVAEAWSRAQQNATTDVHVDPENSKRSVWLDEDSSVKIATIDALSARASNDADGEAGRTIAATVLFALAGIGTLVAFWIQVSCLIGKPVITAEANGGVFFGMHFGAILCGIASQMLASKKGTENFRTLFRKGTNSDKPSGLLKWLGAYYFLVFVYGWVRMAARDGDPKFWGVLIFSCAWLLFYLSSASLCWKVLTHTEQRPEIS